MASATSVTTDKPASRRGYHSTVLEASTTPKGVVARVRGVKTGWACLLLAEDAARRQGLVDSAIDGGWEPIVCSSIGEAVRQNKRWVTQLAAIDLGEMSDVQKAAYLKFAGTLVARDRLLVISDEPTSAEGELWARQAGAWLYLPGPDFQEGMAGLFAEARSAAESILASALS